MRMIDHRPNVVQNVCILLKCWTESVNESLWLNQLSLCTCKSLVCHSCRLRLFSVTYTKVVTTFTVCLDNVS